ncbi:penicillin-binding transpeptidase domain-containing protein [Georgenia yuyongxinii]
MTEDEIDTRGLDIVTSIDQRSQDAAVQAVANLPDDRPENNKVSLVSIDPTTGGIVALYGGPDYVAQPRNGATQDRAQAGSTFKPFALIAGLEQGKSLYDGYSAPARLTIGDWSLRNFDERNHGWVNLIEATAGSINTAYAQLNEEVGPENTRDVATRAGLPEDTPGLTADIANVLGPASPTSLEMATAFATFASQGVRYDPFIVAAVRDAGGNTVYTGGGQGERQFDEQVMADATYAMQAVVDGGGGEDAALGSRPVAGKTGTSSDLRSANFGGYVPQLATFVNMYQVGEDGGEESLTGFGGIRYIGGGQFPAQIWRDYMAVATEGMPVEEFPEPSPRPRRTVAPPPEEPTTEAPTEEPTTEAPSPEPTTQAPTEEPTTEAPTEEPTEAPTQPEVPLPGQPTAPGQQAPPTTPPAGGDTQGQGRLENILPPGRDTA